jgi:uncharacterized protein YegL
MPVTSVFLVVDTSEAMASGRHLERLQRGLDAFVADLADEKQSELEVAIFTSSGVVVPITPAERFVVPRLDLAEPFEFGPALERALEAAAAFGTRCKSSQRPLRRPVVVVVSAGTPEGEYFERAARFARAAETTGRALVLAIGVGPSVDLDQLAACSPSDSSAHRVAPGELLAFFEWLAAKLRGEAYALPGSGSEPEGGGSPPAEVGKVMRVRRYAEA